MSGKLFVIEGACDGIGKTTQYKKLKEKLISDGNIVISHHFPSYSEYQAVGIEKYLSGEFGNINDLSPYFINNLYANDRAITWYTKLKKEYEKGNIILLDRYVTSTLIYQSAMIEDTQEKKEFIDYVMDYEYNKLGIKKPDKVIFLNAPFDLISKVRSERSQNEGINNDIHESDIKFMKKVYENAQFVSNYLNWDCVDCNNQNDMKPIEEIHQKIYNLINKG